MSFKKLVVTFLLVASAFMACGGGSSDDESAILSDGLGIRFKLDGIEHEYQSLMGITKVYNGDDDGAYLFHAWMDPNVENKANYYNCFRFYLYETEDMVEKFEEFFLAYTYDNNAKYTNDGNDYDGSVQIEITNWEGPGGIAKGKISGILPCYNENLPDKTIECSFILRINQDVYDWDEYYEANGFSEGY